MAVIAGLLYVFAETFIKKGIETAAGWSLGAEVNVASVELHYSPLLLKVNGFEATDAKQPTQNVFSFASASAGVDVWQYLLGKVIIDELTVEKLSFMTPRKSAGEVYKNITDQVSDAASDGLGLPDVEVSLPDSKTLLASLEKDNNLQTLKAAEALKLSYQQESEKLAALKANLPSKEKLEQYKQQVQALTNTKVKSLADIDEIKVKFAKIKQQFKADQVVVKQAKDQLSASKMHLAKQMAALKVAPAQDWQYIEKRYQLDNIDGEDFAHLLFGEQARGYYQKAEMIYQRLLPLLASDNKNTDEQVHVSRHGRFVFFSEDDPMPAVLVKKAHIDMVLPEGDFSIQANELTHQHWLRQQPSTLQFSSKNLLGNGKLLIDSEFSVSQQSDINAKGHWTLDDLQLTETELRKSKSLNIMLTKGDLSGTGEFSFSHQSIANSGTKASDNLDVNSDAKSPEANIENMIKSENNFTLSDASYQGDANSQFTKIALSAIKSLDTLTLGITATGDIAKPELSIDSSLDKAMGKAFSQQASKKLASLKQNVNASLNQKLASALKVNNTQASELVNFESLLTDKDNALTQLLKTDVVKQQQDKLKNKAKDKLTKKLGKLFG